jgi:hypothetical protein
MLPPAAGAEPAPGPEELARIADRQQAQEELAGMFDILPADFEGERLPNQVTREEYEALCNNYSDIRTGSSQIKIDAGERQGEEADSFKGLVLDDIESLLQTPTGRELIEQLATARDAGDSPLATTIKGAASPLQARAYATARTQSAIDWSENGIGTDMSVEYAPGRDVVRPGATDAWAPIRSDVALLHELVHALHGTHGYIQQGGVTPEEAGPGDVAPPGAEPVPLEEYATVGLGRFANSRDRRFAVNENAYRAERRALAGTAAARGGDDAWSMERRTDYMVTTDDDEEVYDRMRGGR